jgi:hypothetical protein
MPSMLCVRTVAEEVLTRMKTRCYRELRRLNTFEERFNYLKLSGVVGESTFGFDRYLNQVLYTSQRWKKTRNNIIIRDNACDLGMDDYEIRSKIIIHHMNPITIDDVELERDIVFDPEFLISTSMNTHNAVHFGDESLLPKLPIERKRNDTCPWK